jgi:nitrogen fixation-related uncharacterized protein
VLPADLAAYAIAIVATVGMVIVVLAAYVWAAIQDGHDDDARRAEREHGGRRFGKM